MNLIVDSAKAMKKWGQILDSLQVLEPEKREWMSVYADMHQMNENVGYSTLGNLNGMGSIAAAQPSAIPGNVWGGGMAYGGANAGGIGSGDIGQNLLPVSMKIAAQTIGLDLVSVKPTASPKIDLLFVDFKYDNNLTGDRFGADKEDKPLVFKLNNASTVVLNALKAALRTQMVALGINERVGQLSDRMFVVLSGASTTDVNVAFGATISYANLIGGFTGAAYSSTAPTTTAKEGWLEFLGFSRIDGKPIFRIFRQVTTPPVGNTVANEYKNTFLSTSTDIQSALATATIGVVTTNSASTAALGGALAASVNISGSTIELVSLMEDHIPGFSAGWYLNRSMTRVEDENTYPGVIGPDVFTKTVQVGDVEISSALKRTQIEDIKAATGMDIVQKLESVLINELTQVISKQIVAKITELANTNRTSYTAPKDGAGNPKFDFNVDDYLAGQGTANAVSPGGETTHSIQRKLIAKINNASNFIATDGRVGPAQYLVTNGNIASVLQDIAGYTINPVQASKLNTNGQLYPMGQIGQIKIYVDPYQRWDDNNIYIGRKNSVDQPGLLFIPYLMAQSISLISEATFAPRMLIRSRFAIADIGFFPEKQFMAIQVTDSNGVLI